MHNYHVLEENVYPVLTIIISIYMYSHVSMLLVCYVPLEYIANCYIASYMYFASIRLAN